LQAAAAEREHAAELTKLRGELRALMDDAAAVAHEHALRVGDAPGQVGTRWETHMTQQVEAAEVARAETHVRLAEAQVQLAAERAARRAEVRGSLGDTLRGSLGDSLRGLLGDTLRGSLGDTLRGSLGDSLRGLLGDTLRGLLGDTLRGSLGDTLRAG
jgi:hypothetical protein